MKIGYRIGSESDFISVMSSSVYNTDLIRFEQPNFPLSGSVSYTNELDYPNVIATDVVHPETGAPLFYRMKLPRYSFSSENELKNAIRMVKDNTPVRTTLYHIAYDDDYIYLYSNLQNGSEPYYITYTPYPNSTVSRPSKVLYSPEPALIRNSDYDVDYINGSYKLSKTLYCQPSGEQLFDLLYTADLNTPWYIFVSNITLPEAKITAANRTITITLTASKISKNLYKIKAKDVYSIEIPGYDVLSVSSDGFIQVVSDLLLLEANVTIRTSKNIVAESFIPVDFRPSYHNYGTYDVAFI